MIAVRVLRQGVVIREQVVSDVPVRIGRAPDNDVVLFDATVSRAHAVVETDASGELVIRDLGSKNAVHLGPRVVSEAHGTRALRCLVGRVEIEVERLAADDTLDLGPQDRASFEQRRTTVDHVRYVALGVLAWLATVVSDSDFWSPWQQNRAGTLLGHFLGAAVALPVVAFVLLGLLRAASRRVRIADTLRALAVVAGIFAATDAVMHAAYYALSVGALATLGSVVAVALTVWAVVYLASLRRLGPSRLFRAAWGAATLALFLGMQTVSSLAQKRMGMPQVDHEVLPPIAALTGPDASMNDFFDRLGSAGEEAARQAADVHEKHASARAVRAGAAPAPVKRP